MPTFKIFAGAKKKDGTHPIYIGVIHQRKRKNIKTNYFIKESEITASGKIKNAGVMDRCEIIIEGYRKTILKLGDRLDAMDVFDIVHALKGNENAESYPFVAFAYSFIEKLRRNGREGNATVYCNAVARFKKHIDGEIDARNITVALLQSLVDDLSGSISARSVHNYFSQISTIFKRMQFELNDYENNIVPLPYNPFTKVSVQKPEQSRKKALTVEQIRQIITFPREKEKFKTKTNLVNIAMDVFVMSFILVGINEADLYEVGADCLKDGRLTYQRKKTRNRRADKAEISIKVEPEAQMYIDHYKATEGDRLFKFSQLYRTKHCFVLSVNKGMKKIGDALGIDDLTFYAARHSWATIAANDCRVDKYTVHQALNHVDPTTAVTDIYIKKDWRNVDEANRKVIDYVANVQHI